jgi:hypothetical protein
MRRPAHFVSKFLIQTFFKKFGGAWGGAPRNRPFFLELFLWPFASKKKRLNAMGSFGKTNGDEFLFRIKNQECSTWNI